MCHAIMRSHGIVFGTWEKWTCGKIRKTLQRLEMLRLLKQKLCCPYLRKQYSCDPLTLEIQIVRLCTEIGSQVTLATWQSSIPTNASLAKLMSQLIECWLLGQPINPSEYAKHASLANQLGRTLVYIDGPCFFGSFKIEGNKHDITTLSYFLVVFERHLAGNWFEKT